MTTKGNKIQFLPSFVNTHMFSEAANYFKKHGFYCSAPEGTPDWYEHWDREWERCKNGFESGGVRITGIHYFYLNYSRISKKKDKDRHSKSGKKVEDFPWFTDMDYYFFTEHRVRECFEKWRRYDSCKS
jgi:hypothetical protein